MKLYRVSTPSQKAQWATSNDAASKLRTAMAGKGIARKDIEVEPIEVPTKKDDLVAWLNERGA